MAVKSYDEIIESARVIIGESTEDRDIAFLEDIADTLAETTNKENEDWKAKYEENDKMWRQKYIDRFSGKKEDEKENEEVEETEENLTFDDLFKED